MKHILNNLINKFHNHNSFLSILSLAFSWNSDNFLSKIWSWKAETFGSSGFSSSSLNIVVFVLKSDEAVGSIGCYFFTSIYVTDVTFVFRPFKIVVFLLWFSIAKAFHSFLNLFSSS